MEQWHVRWLDYYRILDVLPDASAEQVREAYRYKAHLLHPDHTGRLPQNTREKAEEEFRQVNEAYETLKDMQRRERYDLAYSSRASDTASKHINRRPSSTGAPKMQSRPATSQGWTLEQVLDQARSSGGAGLVDVHEKFLNLLQWARAEARFQSRGKEASYQIHGAGATFGYLLLVHANGRLYASWEGLTKSGLTLQAASMRRIWSRYLINPEGKTGSYTRRSLQVLSPKDVARLVKETISLLFDV